MNCGFFFTKTYLPQPRPPGNYTVHFIRSTYFVDNTVYIFKYSCKDSLFTLFKTNIYLIVQVTRWLVT